ncbi:amidohydrolase/deacetylase family metallohydrolase [Flagellimonas sp. S3867]|uniref:amidohydrolase/deacetylase family metallohydrolase n=1 Tax=Flagellimonas sp. S3867 TaxID=2768063 RepID=UPI001686B162|nr:amidohydrolase/deacetylase family metallohydrolase [Flagellimonas sp. S3867]
MILNNVIKNTVRILILSTLLVGQAQEIDLLIKNGHVFDAKNNLDTVLDIAITDGKIVKVAPDISVNGVKKVVDATDLYVCPGLIDIHTHVFVGSKPGVFADGINSLSPDDFTFRAGITTVVDAGTSGWRNFPQFKSQVIDQSKTRVLAFLNIAGDGMSGNSSQQNIDDMDVHKTSEVSREYSNLIVGTKIGHFEGKSWTPFDKALKVGLKTDTPLFVECHLPQYSLKAQLDRMRPGDIITHSYENISERMPVVDDEGKVHPFVLEAKEKGILFDVGHGGAGFWFDQAIPALEQGLWPNTFGTDLHRFSMNAGMKDMLNVMSKYLNMGMPLNEVLLRGSWNPAQAIKREDLGHLSVGAEADIVLLSLKNGKFGFIDAAGNRIAGNRKFEAELTLRAGKVVWDLNGLAAKDFKK